MTEDRNASPAEIYGRYLGSAIADPFARVLLELAAPQRGERVLDLACGTGSVAKHRTADHPPAVLEPIARRNQYRSDDSTSRQPADDPQHQHREPVDTGFRYRRAEQVDDLFSDIAAGRHLVDRRG